MPPAPGYAARRPDAHLVSALRAGDATAMRPLYQRHYAAVYAYACTCVRSPLDAHELTRHAFAELLAATLAGELSAERRHPGCVRLQLHDKVLHKAISWARSQPTAMTPHFAQWVNGGAERKPGDGQQLAMAFALSPAALQCLLWHALVEKDDPAPVARIIGVGRGETRACYRQALALVRRLRTELHLDRSPAPSCHAALRPLVSGPVRPLTASAARHMADCPACKAVYDDVRALGNRLERLLPGRVLGWWPEEDYQRLKVSQPPPVYDPPCLQELLRHADEQGPLRKQHTHLTACALPPARARVSTVRHHRSAVLTDLIMPAGMRTTAGQDAEHIPLQAPHGVAARCHRAAQGAVREGRGEVSLLLGRSAVLWFPDVDFSANPQRSATARLNTTVEQLAVLEMRLGSPTAEPFARFGAPAYRPLDVTTTIRDVSGVHDVFVTVVCSTDAPGVEFHGFATTPGPRTGS